MKNNKITFVEIKKYLKEKGFTLTKKNNNYFKNNSLNTLSRTLLSSVIIICSFYVIPVFINFKSERISTHKEFKNDSKNIFKNTKDDKGQNKLSKLDEELLEKYIFEDVLEINELPNDYVRLSASTLEQLFKDTNYNLKDVRKKKLVKPISLSLLPQEMKMIENAKTRKNLFIKIILPLVIKENNNIKLERKKLFNVINKSNNTS